MPNLRPSVFVELVGPPGAGKSSVVLALVARSNRVKWHNAPEFGELGFGVLLRTLPTTLRTLVGRGATRRPTREQLRLMIYLEALSRLVERRARAAGDGSILVLDQGPLYLLSRPRLLDSHLATWREGMFETFSSLLDAVVWLDAPDDVLVERISGRTQRHRLKGAPLATALGSLATTRTALEEALSRLGATDESPMFLRFDTSRVSSGEIAETVLCRVGGVVRTNGAVGVQAAQSDTRG